MGINKGVLDELKPQLEGPALETTKKDRRSQRRATLTMQVRVRGMNGAEAVEEVCETLDVSGDGLLFVSHSQMYARGQLLDVTFPYSSDPSARNHSQSAEVVRVNAITHGKVTVAVHFLIAQKELVDSNSAANP